jgi:hypothetical protein
MYYVYHVVRLSLYKIRYSSAKNKWIAGQGANPDEVVSRPSSGFINRVLFRRFAILVVIAYLALYAHQRFTWVKSDSMYPAAKEYWMAGQVVYTPRRIMEFIVHPDNFLIRPFAWLQRSIFNRGVTLLPEEDGERFVWENHWFLYPYTRKKHRPYFVTSDKYEPKMVALLDRCWAGLEGMMTLPIADPHMLRNSMFSTPLLADYYSLLDGHYTGKYRGAGTLSRKTPFLVERQHILLQWMDKLERNWKSNGLYEELLSKYPAVLMNRQVVVLRLHQELSLSRVMEGKFSCEHPLILRLHKEYIDAMSTDPNRNFFLFYSKRNREQAKIAYKSTVYHAPGGAANYLLSTICGKTMPKEPYVVVTPRDAFVEFDEAKYVKLIFSEELENLKDWNNE